MTETLIAAAIQKTTPTAATYGPVPKTKPCIETRSFETIRVDEQWFAGV